jgi:glyoxylase-like metal-dependent hydrolase (beta-lactamase superfamily II)
MMKTQTRPRYEEIYPRIYRIILPLPGDKPGPVNTYLFTGKTVTMLDTGTLKTVHILEQTLNQIGYTFSDIDQIVLTHGHIDHYGAARKIVEGSQSPVTVVAHEEDQSLIEHGVEVPQEQFVKYYQLMGVPLIFQDSLRLMGRIFSFLAENCQVDRFISDGDKISMGDYEASVIGTPGHTRGSISLYLEKEGLLFPGDHMLGHITPNAFVMLEADSDLPCRMSQIEFYDSLRKIEDIAPRTVYPAHGEPIHDAKGIITMFREQFSLRQNDILSILAGGRYTAYQIGRKLFPDLSDERLPLEIFLMVSEVYTHLQVLMKENRARSCMNDQALYFTAGTPG